MTRDDVIAALERRISLLDDQIKWAMSMDYNVPDLDPSDLEILRALADSLRESYEVINPKRNDETCWIIPAPNVKP